MRNKILDANFMRNIYMRGVGLDGGARRTHVITGPMRVLDANAICRRIAADKKIKNKKCNV